ncbi:MAG: preprotein translocase subunit SecE [Bacillota bacterium]
MAVKSVSGPAKFSERATKFFRGVWSELKKVHWPNRKEIATYTTVVVVSVFIVALMIWIVDSIFSFLLSRII